MNATALFDSLARERGVVPIQSPDGARFELCTPEFLPPLNVTEVRS